MAKKKKTKTTKRRHKVGALALSASSPLVKYGTIGLGFLMAAGPLATAVDKALVKVTDPEKQKMYKKLIYGGITAGGAYMMFMDKSKKSVIKTALSGVAIGAGLKNALSSFGIGAIGGYGNVPAINGYGQVPAIGYGKGRMNGYQPQGTLTGYGPQGTLAGPNVMGSFASRTNTGGSGNDLMNDGGSSSLIG